MPDRTFHRFVVNKVKPYLVKWVGRLFSCADTNIIMKFQKKEVRNFEEWLKVAASLYNRKQFGNSRVVTSKEMADLYLRCFHPLTDWYVECGTVNVITVKLFLKKGKGNQLCQWAN